MNPPPAADLLLTGPLQKRLRNELVVCARTRSRLDQFITFELDFITPAEIEGATPIDAASDLVVRSVAKNKVRELLIGAVAHFGDPRGEFAATQTAAGDTDEATGRVAREHRRLEALGAQLNDAQRRRSDLASRGSPSPQELAQIDQEIVRLRRELRSGPQLHTDEWLGAGSGRFRLRNIIGDGGYSTVWRAYDSQSDREVAVKVMHPDKARDLGLLARFTRGARTMLALQDEHIARVLEPVQEHEGFHYFVMNLYTADLSQVRARVSVGDSAVRHNAALSAREGLRLVIEAGRGLRRAHARSLVHRDVKPANILIDDQTHAHVTDFDLVLAMARRTGGTATSFAGTYLYAAPELMTDAARADVRADVYGLGMTAIFALSGVEPPSDPLWRLQPTVDFLDCGDELKDCLLRAIAWDRNRRFSTMDELVRELQKQYEKLPDGDLVVPANWLSAFEMVKRLEPTPSPSEWNALTTRLRTDVAMLAPHDRAPWPTVALSLVEWSHANGRDVLELIAAVEATRPGTSHQFAVTRVQAVGARPQRSVETPGRVALLRELLELDEARLEELVFRMGLKSSVRNGAQVETIRDVVRVADLLERRRDLGNALSDLLGRSLLPRGFPAMSGPWAAVFADIARALGIETLEALQIPEEALRPLFKSVRTSGRVPRHVIEQAWRWFGGEGARLRSFLDACDEIEAASRRLALHATMRGAVPLLSTADLRRIHEALADSDQLFELWKGSCGIPWWACGSKRAPLDTAVFDAIDFGAKFLPDPRVMSSAFDALTAGAPPPRAAPALPPALQSALERAPLDDSVFEAQEHGEVSLAMQRCHAETFDAIEHALTDGHPGRLGGRHSTRADRCFELIRYAEARGHAGKLRALHVALASLAGTAEAAR